ncbi:MAG: hypothetical protein PHQ40_08265 [Anaerolineaceae bacterium]|nr:hypothetical protein [Anaerolineaceae bacterium]
MKPLKLGLRIWIALSSIIAFLGGWALFSHANKPVSIFSAPSQSQSIDSGALAPIPTLPPVPSLDQLTNGSRNSAIQPLPPLPQISSQQFMPRLRTMGS